MFSVDVEDYYMSPETIPFEDWPQYPPAIEEGMRRCLDLLDEFHAKATFFFVGWLAERHPRTVEWTAGRGHEIGTHTHTHHYVNEMDEARFEESVARSLKVLREIVPAAEIIGHRAPAFSLSRSKRWQFEVLKRHGIRYDSSINPHQTYLYGDRNAPLRPHRLHGLIEIPPAAIRLFGRNWPVGGGGTLRILPSLWQRFARARAQASGWPPVIYMHPWEFLRDHPPLNLPFKQRMIHHWGLRTVEPKLRSFFRSNQILTMRQYHDLLADILPGES